DSRYGKARIAAVDAGRIQGELEDGRVVVVAGFQGITEDMDVTTLGRGASDLSAVAIAAAIRADRCEVYTDVEGIYTADPRHVPNARKLDEVGYEEMLEMASLGAKMQPRSIELAMQYHVPVMVASSFIDAPGTLIHKGADMEPRVGEIRNRARAVATERNVTKITVTGIVDRPGISAGLLEPLADADISVDVIVQNASVRDTTDLAFTVTGGDSDRALEIVRTVAYTIGANDVIRTDNLAKVSVVGAAMQNTPGYASRMFRALADEGINIEMITTSEIRITCVVDADRVGQAARALHMTFGLEKPD
ncbi:MAG: aspartate kinase, partial [Chloroflexota bacterium]|nr:aspartate kinase [Chloroflexota bacterium]